MIQQLQWQSLEQVHGEAHYDVVVVVRPSRSDEDHFSHPGVEGAGLICEYAGGCKGHSASRRFSGSVDRGWEPHVLSGVAGS